MSSAETLVVGGAIAVDIAEVGCARYTLLRKSNSNSTYNTWEAMQGPFYDTSDPVGSQIEVNTLSTVDIGEDSWLFAGVQRFGGPISGLQFLYDEEWLTPDTGTDGEVRVLLFDSKSLPPCVWVAGNFAATVGELPMYQLGRLILCTADFNRDGSVDFFDYDDFTTAFAPESGPQDPSADFNRDGAIDFFDYDDFVAAFEAGCTPS